MEGLVTRVLEAPPNVNEEMITPPTNKSLSADWEHVLSQRSTQAFSVQFGYQLTPYSDAPGAYEDKPTVDFLTGSSYTGQWNIINMAGFGTYRMPHGVEYEGELRDGMFHGEGTLIYPNGTKIFGEWRAGRMTKRKYQYSDGLQFSEHDWKYCQMPDRRFYVEHTDGLKPAGRSLRTQQIPTREIPKDSYDTGDGFYNPRTKCVTDPKTNEVLRIPTDAEDAWIKANCRRAWDENCGFRPDLYENWYDPEFKNAESTSSSDDGSELHRVNSSEEFSADSVVDLGSSLYILNSNAVLAPIPVKGSNTSATT